MRLSDIRVGFTWAIGVFLLVCGPLGCAPSHLSEKSPDWGYDPPESVSEEHQTVCAKAALSAARKRSFEVTSSSGAGTVGTYGGIIGFTGVALFLRGEEEEAYEQGFEECLREKGYEID